MKPFFDPKRARLIGARRLERAARAFAKAHRWKRTPAGIVMPKSRTIAARDFAELGEALLRSGGLEKTRAGYRDLYTGKIYGAPEKTACTP